MKDQYFGDARDYLKYHLLEELLARVPRLRRLVCLWMLTPPDKTAEGNVPFLESTELPQLTAFLRLHRAAEDRCVRHMREYFRDRGISYVPWGDERPYFTSAGRDTYFRTIPDEQLQEALVFFDPDIGLTSAALTSKHLTFDEVTTIRDRMSADSLAVVYQHFQRKPEFWETMAMDIRRRVGAPVGYVAEPGVAFFVIPKNAAQIQAIDEALQRVATAGRSRKVGTTQR